MKTTDSISDYHTMPGPLGHYQSYRLRLTTAAMSATLKVALHRIAFHMHPTHLRLQSQLISLLPADSIGQLISRRDGRVRNCFPFFGEHSRRQISKTEILSMYTRNSLAAGMS